LQTAFLGGSFAPEFERNFAQWMQAPYCIGVGNGIDATDIAI
jgi:dTDP-4-amino-4,6-dideoxygalactose transaminase